MASRYVFSPIIPKVIPAIVKGSTLRVYFSLNNLNQVNDIKHIQFNIKFQSNNKNALLLGNNYIDNNYIIDEVIYIPWSSIGQENNQYYFDIKNTYLKDGWNIGGYYKIQSRFGLSELPAYQDDYSWFSNWDSSNKQNNLYSEWSTVAVTKVIPKPDIGIIGLTNQDDISSGQQSIVNTGSLTGYYYNEDSQEIVDKYRFRIYQDKNGERVLVEDSGEKTHNSQDDFYISEYKDVISSISSIDIFNLTKALDTEVKYILEYSIITYNLYTESKEYSVIIRDDINEVVDTEIEYELNQEEAYIDIKLTNINNLIGNYVLSRSDETSNYTIWEDLAYLSFPNDNNLLSNIVFTDFCIESGLGYQYGIQKVYPNGLRTQLLYEVDKDPARCFYEYSYLYENGKQLKLKFDNKVNNFKQTHLESKQDTMGSKYPFITRNGITSYHEFSFNGLISYFMDEAESFIDNFISVPVLDGFIPTTNLTFENTYVERNFRQNVINWLNNGNYKLYKSPTEGLMAVTLLNVSFSPVETVNRMLYSFSASAYEIADTKLSTLSSLGIYNKGSLDKDNIFTISYFGQIIIEDNPLQNIDLLKIIKDDIVISLDSNPNDYLIEISSIKDLQIESLEISGDGGNEIQINGNNIVIKNDSIFNITDISPVSSLVLIKGNDLLINYNIIAEISEQRNAGDFIQESFIVFSPGSLSGEIDNNIDILDIIKEKEIKELENADSSYVYEILYFSKIEIETDPGTVLLIGNNENEVVIGESGTYRITHNFNEYLGFANESAYAIVNYEYVVLKEKRNV